MISSAKKLDKKALRFGGHFCAELTIVDRYFNLFLKNVWACISGRT
jgi:small nuclear ribonucleoprotein (snRNP)-like protein